MSSDQLLYTLVFANPDELEAVAPALDFDPVDQMPCVRSLDAYAEDERLYLDIRMDYQTDEQQEVELLVTALEELAVANGARLS